MFLVGLCALHFLLMVYASSPYLHTPLFVELAVGELEPRRASYLLNLRGRSNPSPSLPQKTNMYECKYSGGAIMFDYFFSLNV